MAIVTRGDGTVLYDGATPGLGEAWGSLDAGDVFSTLGPDIDAAFLSVLAPELRAAIAAGTAPIALGAVTAAGAGQISRFAGLDIADVPGVLGSLNIPKGLFLSTGSSTIPLSNTGEFFGEDTDAEGDADLLEVVQDAFPGQAETTQDAASLSLSFRITDPSVTSLTFDLVFGSDEFPEFATNFVDGAAVIVDGVNYALFGGQAGRPLSVTEANVANGFFYNNSIFPTTGSGAPIPGAPLSLPLEFDGVSSLLRITATLGAGVDDGGPGRLHTLKIVIGDTNDGQLDSGLWIGNLDTGNATNPFLGQRLDFDDVPEARSFFGSTATLDPDSAAAQAFVAQFGQAKYGLLSAAADQSQELIDRQGDFGSTLSAFGGNDVLRGQGGDDTLIGGGGDDTLDGGTGDDRAVFSGNRADYLVGFDAGTNTLSVKDQRSGAADGTDTVQSSVERLVFADGSALFSSFVPVVEPNGPPVAANDAGAGFTTRQGVAFTTANVLANDSDPDAGDILTLAGFDATGLRGTLVSNGDGTFRYQPAEGFAGTDSFTYTVRDGDGLLSTARVDLLVQAAPPPPVIALASAVPAQATEGTAPGTGGGFTITLTRSGDLSAASSVELLVSGTGGNPAEAADLVGGFAPRVVAFAAGAATATLVIRVSPDALVEGPESLLLRLGDAVGATAGTGTLGAVILDDDATTPPPSGGRDYVRLTPGSDAVSFAGRDGAVAVQALDGNDAVTGTRFADALNGGAGSDRLRGGGGDDVITGGAGGDRLLGGAGRDVFVFGKGDLGTGGADGFDQIVDFEGAGDGFRSGDLIRFRGFSDDATFTLLGNAPGNGSVLVYEVADADGYAARLILQLASGGGPLVAGDYGFV